MPITPNMLLDLATPGVTPGPDWADDVNASFDTVDVHDHSTGKGVRITPAGFNVSTDLPFNDHNATEVRAVRLETQAITPADPDDLQEIYSRGGELYYIDASGNDVQITSGGTVNVSSPGGGFSGDFGAPGVTASVPYSDTTKVYSFLQDAGITGSIACYQLKLFDDSSGANGITISPPSTAVTAYTFTLPAALTASQQIMQITSAGAVLYSNTIPTATIFSSTVATGALTVTGAATISTTLGVTGATTLGNTLAVTGATTLSSTLAVTGNITATANIVMSNGAGSYTAPRILAQNNNGDCTGIGVYRNGSTPSGIGMLATASNARIYYTEDGGTNAYSLINVVAATGVISIGNGTFDSVAHTLSGSLNFGSTAALPANGLGRSGANQLSITTGSTERIRVADATVTVRNALLAESTCTVQGAIDANSTADFQGTVNFQANPTGTIESGTDTPTFTASSGTSTATATASQWLRVGDTVFVTVNFNGTLDGTGLIIGAWTIPTSRASNFSGTTRAAGTCTLRGFDLVASVSQVTSVTGAKTVAMTCTGTASNTYTAAMVYSYRLING